MDDLRERRALLGKRQGRAERLRDIYLHSCTPLGGCSRLQVWRRRSTFFHASREARENSVGVMAPVTGVACIERSNVHGYCGMLSSVRQVVSEVQRLASSVKAHAVPLGWENALGWRERAMHDVSVHHGRKLGAIKSQPACVSGEVAGISFGVASIERQNDGAWWRGLARQSVGCRG